MLDEVSGMFVNVTTARGEAVAINVATVSYVGRSKSGVVTIVLMDGSSFNVSDDYEEVLSAIEKAASAKTA